MHWAAPSTLTLPVQRLWSVGAFLEPAWAYKEQEKAESVSSWGTARWKEQPQKGLSLQLRLWVVHYLLFVLKVKDEENKVPGVWGRGRCGSRCESCGLFQQPRVEPWLRSQCWVQEWCHVSPDHGLSANDLPSSLTQPIIHMTLLLLKWIIKVLRLKCLRKCLWLPRNLFTCLSANTQVNQYCKITSYIEHRHGC